MNSTVGAFPSHAASSGSCAAAGAASIRMGPARVTLAGTTSTGMEAPSVSMVIHGTSGRWRRMKLMGSRSPLARRAAFLAESPAPAKAAWMTRRLR